MDAASTRARAERGWWIARGVGAVGLLAYFVVIMTERMAGAQSPWAIDGDMPQAVWQYWRYHVPGALPPGHLLTDYAFVMHAPPTWWAMMASLSTVFEPILAAKILQVVAWAGLTVCIVVIVGKRTEWLLGFFAAFLCLRNPALLGLIGGGYARSFGPFLTMLFLAAFLFERHRLCLFILVLQASLYPSVVVPSGLTYGAYCVIKGPMRERLRRCAGMFVAGLLVIAFGMYQDIEAPRWWGSVVTLAQAEKMPAWHAGGRSAVLPLSPPMAEVRNILRQPFKPGGHVVPPVARFTARHPWTLFFLPALLALVAVAVDRARRLWGGDPRPDVDARIPWQLVAISAGSFGGYVLARVMAFKLYLPDRQLNHVLPYVVYTGLPIIAWCGARAVVGPYRSALDAAPKPLSSKRRALVLLLAVVVGVLPIAAARGDGLQNHSSYRRYGSHASVFLRVRRLPLTSTIACDRYWCEYVGLFTYHQVFVARNLAHPFRLGLYKEMERRLVETHEALYATSWQDVLDFARREKIDYFLYDTKNLERPEQREFHPVTEMILPYWRKGHAEGMVMASPPKEAVIYRHKNVVLLDVKKLAHWVAHPPPPPFIGPLPEGAAPPG